MFDINLDFLHKIIHRSIYKNNGEKKEKYLYDKTQIENGMRIHDVINLNLKFFIYFQNFFLLIYNR